jgi:hypothetical protein
MDPVLLGLLPACFNTVPRIHSVTEIGHVIGFVIGNPVERFGTARCDEDCEDDADLRVRHITVGVRATTWIRMQDGLRVAFGWSLRMEAYRRKARHDGR